jgi:hypothetical protein
VKADCASAGFNGRTVTFRYDTETLQLVECEVVGDGPAVLAMARRDDGSQEAFVHTFTQPETAAISGLSFAGLTPDGDPYGLLFSMNEVPSPT